MQPVMQISSSPPPEAGFLASSDVCTLNTYTFAEILVGGLSGIRVIQTSVRQKMLSHPADRAQAFSLFSYINLIFNVFDLGPSPSIAAANEKLFVISRSRLATGVHRVAWAGSDCVLNATKFRYAVSEWTPSCFLGLPENSHWSISVRKSLIWRFRGRVILFSLLHLALHLTELRLKTSPIRTIFPQVSSPTTPLHPSYSLLFPHS